MNIELLSTAAAQNQFTGYEHARIVDLLTVLAFVSIAMWAIVGISIIFRQGAILLIRSARFIRNHPIAFLKSLGRNNGS